jgi:hypothetical protein
MSEASEANEEVPKPPEGWHIDNKSDVPEEELEGLDDD